MLGSLCEHRFESHIGDPRPYLIGIYKFSIPERCGFIAKEFPDHLPVGVDLVFKFASGLNRYKGV